MSQLQKYPVSFIDIQPQVKGRTNMSKAKATNARDKKAIEQAKSQSMSDSQFKATKKLHKQEIKRLKSQIKKHKLLIKQAKLVRKISEE